MGKKYIIELEDKPFNKGNGDFLYRVKGFNSLVFDMTGVGKLTPYTEPDMEKVREEAFKSGYDAACKDIDIKSKIKAAYRKGLEDAWAAARRIIHMPEGDLLNIFTECYSAVCTALQVLLKYDAAEAIEKLKAYEQEQQIQVGDEVAFHYDDGRPDTVVVVTYIGQGGEQDGRDDTVRQVCEADVCRQQE